MNGGIVAIVPIRSLTGGKTRLAGALTSEARAALTRRMLVGVVAAALASEAVTVVAVISPDPEALALAGQLGRAVVAVEQDAHAPGLNAAIATGVRFARERGAAAVLVLFGDLPLLAGDDVRNMLRRDAPVVLAPDRHGTGTNALLLRLGRTADDGRSFGFHFGPDSYAHHVAEAHGLGLEVATALSAGTALDLDTPEDLRLIGDGGWGMGDGVLAGGRQVGDPLGGIDRHER